MCTSSHLKLLESNSTAKEKSIKIIKRKENKKKNQKKTDEQRTVIICAAADKNSLTVSIYTAVSKCKAVLYSISLQYLKRT